MLVCPNCQQETFDEDAKQCRKCGIQATDDPTLNETALEGLRQAVMIRLFDLAPHEFQQILGPFSGRIGQDQDDGISFTAETSQLVKDHLTKHGIRCARVIITENRSTMYSLVVANTDQGIERCLQIARKSCRQRRARLIFEYQPMKVTP